MSRLNSGSIGEQVLERAVLLAGLADERGGPLSSSMRALISPDVAVDQIGKVALAAKDRVARIDDAGGTKRSRSREASRAAAGTARGSSGGAPAPRWASATRCRGTEH